MCVRGGGRPLDRELPFSPSLVPEPKRTPPHPPGIALCAKYKLLAGDLASQLEGYAMNQRIKQKALSVDLLAKFQGQLELDAARKRSRGAHAFTSFDIDDDAE